MNGRLVQAKKHCIAARKMRFVSSDRLGEHRYVQSLWNAHPNGQQPFVSHARMNSRKGLEKRRRPGLASSACFQQVFGGASRRKLRRERRPRTIWRRSRPGYVPQLLAKPTGSRMLSDKLKTALGEAVAAVWGKLPAEVQQALFEAAVDSVGEGSREKLAIYLHRRHPRTPLGDKPGREVPEPDSLGG